MEIPKNFATLTALEIVRDCPTFTGFAAAPLLNDFSSRFSGFVKDKVSLSKIGDVSKVKAGDVIVLPDDIREQAVKRIKQNSLLAIFEDHVLKTLGINELLKDVDKSDSVKNILSEDTIINSVVTAKYPERKLFSNLKHLLENTHSEGEVVRIISLISEFKLSVQMVVDSAINSVAQKMSSLEEVNDLRSMAQSNISSALFRAYPPNFEEF